MPNASSSAAIASISTRVLSRDGTKLLFLRGSGRDTNGLTVEVADPDGTAIRDVTPKVQGLDWLDWSPDGSQIVFLSRKTAQGPGLINVVNVDGSGLTTLDVGRSAHFVSWLPPIGREIVFRGEHNTTAQPPAGIWAVHPDGTGLRALITSPAADPNDYLTPAVAPDGSKVSYTSVVPTAEVHILDLRTGNDAVLPSPDGITDQSGVAYFSPDGRFVGYVRSYPDKTFQFVVAPIDGSGTGTPVGPRLPDPRGDVNWSFARTDRPSSSTTAPSVPPSFCPWTDRRHHPRPEVIGVCGRPVCPALTRRASPFRPARPGRAGRRPLGARARMAHGPHDHAHPRRRHRSGAGGGDDARARRDGDRLRMGVRRGGRGGHREVRHPAPGSRPRVRPPHESRAERSDHDPVGSGFRSVNVGLRQALGLYANLRPARSMRGVESRYEDVDLIIVRENTEDLYAGIEHMVGRDAAESIKIITREASERIARFAFDYAVANGRRKVTAVHKANIMKLSDGLFLESCRTVAAAYEGRVEFEDRIVDNMCMQLVQKPDLYDVLVLPNLYGDIVSDLAAGLVGGLGVAPGANIGTEAAVFEPVHGSAPKYAGLDKANPTALILSGALMLRHIGYPTEAAGVEEAVRSVVAEGRTVTYDLGGTAGTAAFADAVIERMAAPIASTPA